MSASIKNSLASRMKFIIAGFIILAALVYLIASSTLANAEYFLTVDELLNRGENIIARSVRVSGAVIEETIQFDPQTGMLVFQIANIPGDNAEIEAEGGLAAILHASVTDASLSRLTIVYHGPQPDLLRNEAQAIITGYLGQDGIFYANELLLKCPTRYEVAVPGQVDAK